MTKSRRLSRQARPSWTLAPLEPRLMLAADVQGDVAPSNDASTSAIVAEPSQANTEAIADAIAGANLKSVASIAFIDSSVEDYAALQAAINQDTEIVLIDRDSDGLQQITEHLSQRRDVQEVHVVSHGSEAAIVLGKQVLSLETMGEHADQLRAWRAAMGENADLLLYGCETGKGVQGDQFIRAMSHLTAADVAASDDISGNAKVGDWLLEKSTGRIDANSLFAGREVAEFSHHLGIEIRAAGTTGEEQLQLEIGGEVVATFLLTGTTDGQFNTFNYDVDGVDVNSIRLNFVNDLYDPENGIDRNVRVDFITVDGTVFQTEDPSVFSTGTWLAADGVQPGFRENETLHTNGFFQFASAPTSDTETTISIFASGSTGEEQMQLLIDGQVVQTFNNIGTSPGVYTFVASGEISASQIRVAFTNDLFDPDNGIDRNLIVDAITVDGVRFESEDPSVFSTGTWLAADGVTPGNRESEFLHTNGFFQYADGPADPPVDPPADPPSDVINFTSFDSSDDLELNGNATLVDGELRLTQALPQQRGSTYFTTPIAVDSSTSFQASFAARFDGGQGSAGGEGLAFVIQNSPAGVNAQNIGNFSGGLDYNALPNSIGIELDTFRNVYEQFADEVTITVDGVLVTPVNTIASPYDLNNGDTYYVWVEYDGESELLSVFLSNENVQPQEALLTANIELDQVVGDQAYLGFAAATGTAFNNTYIESWNVAVNSANSDPDSPGSFVVASEAVGGVENTGAAVVTVTRVGGSRGAASVEYLTFDDTAIAGVDYVTASGTLEFADGETSRSIFVTLLDDDEIEGTESFSLRLTGSTGANLLTPRTATVNIIDDDSLLPTFSSFQTDDGLELNGDAQIIDGELRLTEALPQQRGSTYYDTAIDVNSSTSFQSFFAARFDGGQGSAGGEGLAFVIQNSPAGVNAQNIGNFSGGLDYNALPNSIGIELDTFRNVYEQYADEITITVNGELVNPVTTIQSPFDLNNGDTYYVWVEYNGDSDVLAVYVNDEAVRPALALLRAELELDQIVGDQAYVGFAAATGTAFNNTYIESWNVTLEAPDPDPGTFPVGDIVENDLISGLNQPLAISWSPDGRNLYIAEKGGVIKVSRDGGEVQTVIDISDRVNEFQDRGLIDFAIHPDFENNPYIYLLFTVDPPEVFDNIGDPFAGPDGRGNRAGQLIRVTADAATDFTSIVADSEVILLGANSTWENFNAFTDSTLDFSEPQAGLNPDGSFLNDFIVSDSRSHTVGSLAFGLDGSLFVSIGDGASFNRTDVRALRVQDLDSLSGKVLRIDALTGEGLSDNPFFNGDVDANRSKVYHYGLRNPWRLSVDQESGQLFIGETGLSNFEEINTGPPGTNFGWPFFEGGQGVNRVTPSYANLGATQAFLNSGEEATPAFIALAHGAGSDTVVLGAVVQDLDLGPQYDGDLFYNDLARGVVRHADLDADGNLVGIQVFTTGAQFVVDIQQGVDGSLYYVNLVEGTVGRWEIV